MHGEMFPIDYNVPVEQLFLRVLAFCPEIDFFNPYSRVPGLPRALSVSRLDARSAVLDATMSLMKCD